MTQTPTAPVPTGLAPTTVTVGTGPLAIEDVVAVARFDAPVVIADAALVRIRESRQIIEGLANDTVPHYGVSTGFGALATKHIPAQQRAQLQRSLVRSHAAGSGPEVEREVVRALQLLRLATLATGRTGVREEVAQTYAALLNAGITPVVHEFGSLGCSGDLAPLAHCALAAMGEGPVRVRDGSMVPAATALEEHGIAPVTLAEKEGLALINGTDGMLGMLVLAITDLRRLVTTADVTAAMSVEGLLGTDDVFAEDLQALRPHPGQAASAANLRKLMRDSEIRESHRTEECTRVQDSYSLRCAPQVAGGARDTIDHATRVAEWELASAVDNPVVTLDGRVESNGNFHGAPVAYVLDFLAIVAADLASISERRTDRFLAPEIQAAVTSSTARTRASASTERRSLRAADQPIDTWSSCMALLGIESTLAGAARRFISDTRAAWVYWAIMWPESTPGLSARNGGSPLLRDWSRNRSVRRSEMLARSAATIARKSRT